MKSIVIILLTIANAAICFKSFAQEEKQPANAPASEAFTAVESPEEIATWESTEKAGTPATYKEFYLKYPHSPRITAMIGTLRGRYWLSMSSGEGVLATVLGTNALAKLSVEDAKALGVVVSKPASSVGRTLKIQATTFDVTSVEMQGPCLVGHKVNGVGVTEVIVPTDNLNATVVLSADGTRLLAWDLSDAKIAAKADTTHATYPNSARKHFSGLNPESQGVTYTQHRK